MGGLVETVVIQFSQSEQISPICATIDSAEQKVDFRRTIWDR